MSSHLASGVTFNCSSVPTSFSRTMAIADRFVVTTSSNSATMPGIMKSRLSSSGLNQTRSSSETSGVAASAGSSSWVYPATSARV